MKRGAKQPTILHVTEAMGGGIVTVLASFSARQAEAGAAVSVYYLNRPETPPLERIKAQFPTGVTVRPFGDTHGKLHDRVQLATVLWHIMNTKSFDIVHLHSSKAGFFGRLIYLLSIRRPRVFYSPHGFPFLRLDVARPVRMAYQVLEAFLAKTAQGLIVTCPSEGLLASRDLKAPNVFTVETGAPHDATYSDRSSVTVVSQPEDRSTYRVTVACVARISYQKAPWRFSAIAKELVGEADFVWIGGGTPEDEQRWLDPSIRITGWLSPNELETVMNGVDVLLFPTLWEGMPLALIQAQAQGIPAVVSDIVGNRDAVVDGETGFICFSEEELMIKTRLLITDETLRRAMSKSAAAWAREHLTDRNLGRQSLEVYGVSNGSA